MTHYEPERTECPGVDDDAEWNAFLAEKRNPNALLARERGEQPRHRRHKVTTTTCRPPECPHGKSFAVAPHMEQNCICGMGWLSSRAPSNRHA